MIEKTSFLTADDLVNLFQLSRRQVYRLSALGKIPAPLRIGGSLRWDPEIITRWLEQGYPGRAEPEKNNPTYQGDQ